MKQALRLLPLLFCLATSARAMTNSITYQGRLSDNHAPANGGYSMLFVLHAHPGTGEGIAVATLPSVAVSNGVFSVSLAFPAASFDGSDRWLAIHVRRGADTNAPFTELTPRQLLSPTPYALMANAVPNGTITSEKLAAGAVTWASLADKPASLADGVDNDTIYSAGAGLSLGAGNQFNVTFGGTGTNALAARSDHHHYGQSWAGSGYTPGLTVHNAQSLGRGITGIQGTGSGLSTQTSPVAGVRGDSSDGAGVVGESTAYRGVFGRVSDTNSANYGVFGHTPSTRGYGVYGQATQATGTNYGGAFYTHSRDGIGVQGVAYSSEFGGSFAGRFENRGYGHGVHAISSRGNAGQFDVTNSLSNGASLIARNQGNGPAGLFVIDNNGNPNSAVSAQSNGSGDALKAIGTGTGDAADFTVLGSTTNRAAVRAVAYSGNKAIHAENSSSVAVYVKTLGGNAVEATATTGTALYGKATSSSGAALEIGGGAIRVAGAGVNTATAAFIHRVSASNTTFDDTANLGEAETWINHPMCNNQPGTIIMVTPRLYVGGGLASMQTLGVLYDSPSGRWVISNGSADEFGDFDSGDEINVLVILP